MTTTEFCDSTGLVPRELEKWLEAGLLSVVDMVGRPLCGLRREFTAEQVERVRVLKAIHQKARV